MRVQLYYGPLTTRGDIGTVGEAIDMHPGDMNGKGEYTFTTSLAYNTSGERGLSVRVLPYHRYLHTSFLPGLITWAKF